MRRPLGASVVAFSDEFWRKCNICGQWKESARYYRSTHLRPPRVYGCEVCWVRRAAIKRWRSGQSIRYNIVARSDERLILCTSCGVWKAPAAFYRNERLGRGYPGQCRACHSASRERSRTPESERARMLGRRYRLGLEDYAEMLAAQAHACAICGVRPDDARNLVVDHCHATGAVRGLLCEACNGGLGFFRDRPERLERAAAYLRRAPEGVKSVV